VENDGRTFTKAFEVFTDTADRLAAKGCEAVEFNVGGLASNFCVEFSANNTVMLAEQFRNRGMETKISYVPEISRGIPIPGGPEVPFSLAGVEGRLAKRGIGTTTVADIVAMTVPQQKAGLQARFPRPGA
jgi:hypothetical protein